MPRRTSGAVPCSALLSFLRGGLVATALLAPATAALAGEDARVGLRFTAVEANEREHPDLDLRGWETSVEIARAETLAVHWAIWRAGARMPRGRRSMVLMWGLAADFVLDAHLFGGTWSHEEGHRTTLEWYGISARNQMSSVEPFPRPATTVRSDLDSLVQLKRRNPSALVRWWQAGFESEQEQLLRVERDVFFSDAPGLAFLSYVAYRKFLYVNYLNRCLAPGERSADCTWWAYDLHRPEEPYDERFPPIGGRTLRRIDGLLSSKERTYLRRQRDMAAVAALLDPHLFGITGFPVGSDTKLTALALHRLAPFGHALELHAFARVDSLHASAAATAYVNDTLVLPGLSTSIERIRLSAGGRRVYGCARVAGWLQPRDLSFRTARAEPGGSLELELSTPVDMDAVELFVRVRAKTAGWAPLQHPLDAGADAVIGLVLRPSFIW